MLSSRFIDAIRRVLLVVVVTAVSVVLWRNWDEVAPHLGSISGQAWAIAIIAALSSPALTMLGWRRVLADLGSPLPLGNAAGVFLVGQLGKYVPGSVWSVIVQTEMAARSGVPRRRTGVVGLITLAMALLTGALLGLPAVPALVNLGESISVALVGLACLAMVVALYPPFLNRAIDRLLRLIRREPLEHELSGRAIITMAVWFILSWVCTGVAVWAFASDLAESSGSSAYLALVCISGFALASAVGMLSIVLPAGVGIREAVLVILLAGLLTAPAATAVVILARFLTVVADVVWALVGWLWARSHHLTPPQPMTTRLR